MTDESTPRALIAAYRACARPSAAAEAELWATLAAAERAGPGRARTRAPGLAPWLALAAGLLLLAAWQLGLAGMFASGHVPRDMRDQAAYDAADPERLELRPREAPAVRWLETETPTTETPATERSETETPAQPRPGPARRQRPAVGRARGSQGGAHAAEADAAGVAAGGGGAPAGERSPGAADRGGAPAGERSPGSADEDRVLAEMALLQAARAALRGGQPEAALALLDRHAESFAAGSMTEERQALRVLALCAAGERARGADEAAAFLGAHPRSTYAARVADACPEEHVSKDKSWVR